jgi:DNA-binding GntR family transcriptional regulator
MKDPRRIRRAADIVYAHLRKQILAGELEPGGRVDADKVAAELDVSLTPIREALLQLESEGLIDRRPYRGAEVRLIEPGFIEETFALRIHLESIAARLGAARLTANDIAEMQGVLVEFEHLPVDDHGHDAFNDVNRRFHFALYDASESPELLRQLEVLNGHADRIRLLAAPRADYGDVSGSHRDIAAACAAGSIDAVEEAVRRHLLSAFTPLVLAGKASTDIGILHEVLRPGERASLRKAIAAADAPIALAAH